jgi:Protein of unknown function (DUF3179)
MTAPFCPGRRGAALLLAFVGITAAACYTSQYRTKPRVAVVDGDPIVQMSDPARFPSLYDPKFATEKEHSNLPPPSARLIALLTKTGPRAYPVGLLDRFEVVNDGDGSGEWVVARCPIVGTVAIFDRHVDGRTLTFENAGALWRDTSVIKDRQTGTLWSSATGQGLYGPLAGRRLTLVPAFLSGMLVWSGGYPDSVYLDAGTSTSAPLMMRVYGASSWQGVSGATTEDRRYKPKSEVFTVADGNEAFAVSRSELEARGRIATRLKDRPLVMTWDPHRDAPRAFRPGPAGEEGEEMAIVPMYWFAVPRHFSIVRTPEKSTSAGAGEGAAAALAPR